MCGKICGDERRKTTTEFSKSRAMKKSRVILERENFWTTELKKLTPYRLITRNYLKWRNFGADLIWRKVDF